MLEIEDLGGLEEELLEEGDGDVFGPGVGLGGEVGGGAGGLGKGWSWNDAAIRNCEVAFCSASPSPSNGLRLSVVSALRARWCKRQRGRG